MLFEQKNTSSLFKSKIYKPIHPYGQSLPSDVRGTYREICPWFDHGPFWHFYGFIQYLPVIFETLDLKMCRDHVCW